MPEGTPGEKLAKMRALANQAKSPLNETFDAMYGKKSKRPVKPIAKYTPPPRKRNCDLDEWR